MMELVNRIGRNHVNHYHGDKFHESRFRSIGHDQNGGGFFAFCHAQLEFDSVGGVFRRNDQETCDRSACKKEKRPLLLGGLELVPRGRRGQQGQDQFEISAESWRQVEILASDCTLEN